MSAARGGLPWWCGAVLMLAALLLAIVLLGARAPDRQALAVHAAVARTSLGVDMTALLRADSLSNPYACHVAPAAAGETLACACIRFAERHDTLYIEADCPGR